MRGQSSTMTATTSPHSAVVPRRTTARRGPVRQALVDALIGAVLEELEAVGVSRPQPVATKHARGEKSPLVSAEG